MRLIVHGGGRSENFFFFHIFKAVIVRTHNLLHHLYCLCIFGVLILRRKVL